MPTFGRVSAFLAGGRTGGPEPASYDPVTGDPLYLPEGWGGPSPDDFNVEPTVTSPVRTTRDSVRGTMFDLDNPVEGYLREKDLTSSLEGMTPEDFKYGLPGPERKKRLGRVGTFIDSFLRRVAKPQRELQELAEPWQQEAERPQLNRSPARAFWESLSGNWGKTAADLSSGLDVGLTLGGPVGRFLGLGGTTVANVGSKLLEGGLMARGANTVQETAENWDNLTPGERAAALGGAAMDVGFGAHGAATGAAADVANATRQIRAERTAQQTADWQKMIREGRAKGLDTNNPANVRINLEATQPGGKDYRGFNRARNNPDFAAEMRTEGERLAKGMQDADAAAREAGAQSPDTPFSDAWWDRVNAAMRDVDRQRARARRPGTMGFDVDPAAEAADAARAGATGAPPPPAAPEYGLVRQFLERDQAAAPPAENVPVRQGEIVGNEPLLPGAIDRGNVIDRVKPIEMGGQVARQPFNGGPIEASMNPGALTDAELRTAYIEAAMQGDTRSLGILDDELSVRRTIGAKPQELDTTPSPFFDQEGRFTIDAGDTLPPSLPPEAQPLTPPPPASSVEAFLQQGTAPEPHPQPPARAGDIVSLTPDQVGQIALDPQTYQFKTGDVRGRTGALEGVTEWDPDSPPITVHQREDGRMFVADGHQRFNKYLELLQSGRTDLPPLRVRVKRGPVESIVRSASLRNVQEGSADPLDIARLIRNGGQLTEGELARIPKKALAGQKLRQGQGLANLGDDAFNQVLAGVAKPEHAAYVGQHIADPAQQATIVQQLGAAGLENAAQAEAFVRSMRDAGFQAEHQIDLFGNRIEAVSLAKPKAQIVDETAKLLRSQRQAFSNALKNADQLEAAGNTLLRDVNAAHADEAGRLKAYFDLLYDKAGTETARALQQAAVDLHNGTVTRAEAARRVAEGVRADLESGNFGAAAGRPPGASGDGRLAGGRDHPAPTEVRPGSGPTDSGLPVDDTASPAEAKRILQDLHRALGEQPLITDEPPPLILTSEAPKLDAPPSRAELESAGQGSMFGAEPAPAPSTPQPAAPELPVDFKKARALLEEHLGKEAAKTTVREVMDDIVARFPKDPVAQAEAAKQWIAGNPKPPAAARPEGGWAAHPKFETGQTRTVEGATGSIEEVKFPEKPAEGVRTSLTKDGFRYDYKDQTWRRPAPGKQPPSESVPSTPTSPRPETGASPAPSAPAPQLPTRAERVRQVASRAGQREAAMQRHAVEVSETRTDRPSPKQDNKDAIVRNEGKVGAAGPVPESIARKAPEAAALRKQLEAWPAKGDPRAEGTAPRQVKARAERLASFIEEPNEANFKGWIEEVLNDADRQGRDALRTGKEGGGTYLASGFAGLEQMFKEHPEKAWLLTRMAVGGLGGALVDKDDPIRGALFGGAAASLLGSKAFRAASMDAMKRGLGAARATEWSAVKEAVRRSTEGLPKLRAEGVKPGQEMSWLQYLRRPEGAFPEHYARLAPGERALEQFLHGHRLPDAATFEDLLGERPGEDVFKALRDIDITNPEARKAGAKVFMRDALKELRKDIKDSLERGDKRRAHYLGLLEKAATDDPAYIYKILPGNAVRKVDQVLTNHAYRVLLGGAIDTAIDNMTQVFLNLKNVPMRDVVGGWREAFTPEGRALTKRFELHRPVDAEDVLQKGKIGELIDEWLHKPLMTTDTLNRRASYLASRRYALRQGVSPELADEWARGAMRQTQSEPGIAGKHPLLREAGPLKMFANYPHLWAEIVADTLLLAKQNPRGAMRLAGWMVGGGLAMRQAGLDPLSLFIPRLAVSTSAIDIGKDLAAHAGIGEAPDHRMREDLPKLLPGGRYLKKVATEIGHLRGKGVDAKTGEHIVRDARGRQSDRHSTLEGLASLVGLDTARKADARELANDIFEFSNTTKTRSALTRRELQSAFADAVDSGDAERVGELLGEMTPRQRREMRRAVGQTKWQRLRAAVPRAQRAEFDRQFGERIRQVEGR